MSTSTHPLPLDAPRSTMTKRPPVSSTSLRPPVWTTGRVTVVLVLMTLLIYGQGLTRSVGEHGDAFHHFMNGIFMHDAFCDAGIAFAHPREYALNYYSHYPAVSLGYYPPGFAAISGLLMLVFGVSGATAQLAVLLSAVALTLFAFAWFRLRFDRLWAAGGTLLMISLPFLVHWGRDIMLEVPALALMMGAIWSFERLLRMDHPTWGMALIWALLSALAFWTRQHTLFLLGIYLLVTLFERRIHLLRCPPVVVSTLLVAAAAGGLIAMTLRLGGDNVGHTVGFTAAHAAERFNLHQWETYLRWLPHIVRWPILAAAALGLVAIIYRRQSSVSILFVWIVLFYIVHSYFKAQDRRYAGLWLPPFYCLALYGLSWLGTLLPRLRFSRQHTGLSLGAACLMILLGHSLVQTAYARVPYVPDAYQRAVDELRDIMPPYSCLTFFPDRPGRPAVCYRLAIEQSRWSTHDIFCFGRIVRAHQVLAGWPARYPDLEAVDRALVSWNIKYILTETPRHLDLEVGDDVVERAVDGVLALGTFRAVRSYDVPYPGSEPDHRTLVLYKRIDPIPFDPAAVPPIHTTRIPTTVVPTPPSK